MTIGPTKPPLGRLLFDAPERPSNIFVAYVDGASRGNPGPASYAVILRSPDGATRFESGKYIGRATNNVAEYYGLITALDYAAAQGINRLLVRSDSELLVRQMQGRYKVKSADLRPLHERARKLVQSFAYFAIEHVPREQNREADELANMALDRTDSRINTEPSTRSSAKADDKRGPSRSSTSGAAQMPSGERLIRARYSAGVLHPLGPLDLTEDEIVELLIHRSRKPA
jgi:ribonuclease HI